MTADDGQGMDMAAFAAWPQSWICWFYIVPLEHAMFVEHPSALL